MSNIFSKGMRVKVTSKDRLQGSTGTVICEGRRIGVQLDNISPEKDKNRGLRRFFPNELQCLTNKNRTMAGMP